MKSVKIHDRMLHVIDHAIPQTLTTRWRQHVLNVDPRHMSQDIGHDFLSHDTVVENNIVKHDSRDTDDVVQQVKKHMLDTVKQLIPSAEYRVFRWYTNLINTQSQAWVHRDSRAPANHAFTMLWFPHERWHVNWGGETLFYHVDTSDIEFFNRALNYDPQTQTDHDRLNDMLEQADITAVIPKPNRMIVFDSSLLHTARSPHVDALRLSTAFKLCRNG